MNKKFMKNYIKTVSKILKSFAPVLLLTPVAHATVEGDIQAKMTALLGHPAQVTNVFDANKQRLNSATTAFQPWSGDYWPDILGGITNHYRDHSTFGEKVNFAMMYSVAYHRFHHDHDLVAEETPENPTSSSWDMDKMNEKLSPSEKYDLLIGDLDFTLTQAVMDEIDFRAHHRLTRKHKDGSDDEVDTTQGTGGAPSPGPTPIAAVTPDPDHPHEDDVGSYADYTDDVEYGYWREHSAVIPYWSGICDGWAPASIYLPRPEKPVTVRGALGHMITFYPDDIKALGSYLFAKTNQGASNSMQYQYAGKRCESKNRLAVDARGMVSDFRCNDVDAGVWHLTLLNRVGKDKMGFIMEIDNNVKVNNHPVSGYKLTYFNLATGAEGTIKESITRRSEINDAYAFRRNPKAVSLVGVSVTVDYMFEPWPEDHRDQKYDDAGHDIRKSKTYVYDLELDQAGNIVGGEWGNRFAEKGKPVVPDQPDFIWMAAPNALAMSDMAQYANPGSVMDSSKSRPFGNMKWAWNGKDKMPEDWLRAAKADETLVLPEAGDLEQDSKGNWEVMPVSARNSLLKAPQPMSYIVYYLFDRARSPFQK